MRADVGFVDPESTLRATAMAMRDHGGATILLGPDGPSSIVTERDLARAIADGADPDTIWAGDVSSTPMASLEKSASIGAAIKCMAVQKVRHLPLKEDGEVVGQIVADDILSLLSSTLADNLLND